MEVNTDSIPLTADPVMVLTNKQEVYELKRENIMLRMRLVKIMVLLENVKKSMEKAKDGIMAQLCDTSLEIAEK
jgi:hypothetical protein